MCAFVHGQMSKLSSYALTRTDRQERGVVFHPATVPDSQTWPHWEDAVAWLDSFLDQKFNLLRYSLGIQGSSGFSKPNLSRRLNLLGGTRSLVACLKILLVLSPLSLMCDGREQNIFGVVWLKLQVCSTQFVAQLEIL